MKTPVAVKLIPLFCLLAFVAIFSGQMMLFKHAEADVDRGIANYQHGNYADAESQMRHALDLNPNNGYASYYLGLSLLHEGNLSEARRRMETARTIAHGDKFMQRNALLEEEVTASLDHLQRP